MRPTPSLVTTVVALLLTGAIFGFFYAWVCSTMWGLDAADPRVAIAAMQAMNASVRNWAFFPAFFLTPVVLAAAAGLAWRESRRRSALWLGSAAFLYAGGALALTMLVNIPMNEALAATPVPATAEEARAVWAAYSPTWQVWNTVRTFASGIALVFGLVGLTSWSRVSERTAPATSPVVALA